MFLPEFAESGNRGKQIIVDFKGLNRSNRNIEGSFEDCKGVSLKEYPYVTLGRAAKREGEFENITAMYYRNGLVIVEDDNFYYNNEFIGKVSTRKKSFCGINTKIVFFPEKMYFDTKNGLLYNLESSVLTNAVFGTGEIELESGGEFFSAGDAVEISGSTHEDNNKSAIIREISENVLKFDEDIFVATEESELLKIERNVPTLEFMCEHGNRVWGVKEDTIYASALGDPTNFNIYDGLSTDSYAVAVASPGEFTAVVSYGNKILFFKEDYIHVIYGTKPANYQLYTYNVPGVEKGAEKSIQIIDEVLYYKGKKGIYAYTGGVPTLISENLVAEDMSGGISGKDGREYFIMLKCDGIDTLYSYDTMRGFWLKEKEVTVSDFALCDGRLLYVSDKKLYSYTQDNNEGAEWEITLKPFTEYLDERKIYSKLFLRYETEKKSFLRVYVKSDMHPYEEVELVYDKDQRTSLVPIYPQRCDSFTIKLCGKGRFKIKTLSREFILGSEKK